MAEEGRTGAQVARNVEVVAGEDAALGGRLGLEVFQLGEDVDVDLKLGQIDELAAASACSELQRARLPGQARTKSHPLLVHQNLPLLRGCAVRPSRCRWRWRFAP